LKTTSTSPNRATSLTSQLRALPVSSGSNAKPAMKQKESAKNRDH